ncbi:hypothetical protein [Sphingomonas sp. PR090111-T3T-6A]|uniref:hypothetical protein n=1 Tax=Sphingomonas sp. PR090111-T3T-6A TaxID=685778 RepID=UPI00037886C8|nr:hypothetical protein [Sphingomonas sp. PR090111-T3T-6A]
MHFERDHLIFKALVALDEVHNQAGEAPMEPSHAVRFVLAWLYSISDGDRGIYDDFYRNMREPFAEAFSREGAAYRRSTYLRSCMGGIARSVGHRDFSPGFFLSLRQARLPKAERMLLRADRVPVADDSPTPSLEGESPISS